MKVINERYCKGCSLCIEICPTNVFDEGDKISELGYVVPNVTRYESCIDLKKMREGRKPTCELCLLSCPDQAITETLYGENDE